MQRWGNLVLSQFKASKFQAEYYHVFEVQYTGSPHAFELLALFRSLSGPIHLFRWSPFSFTTPINPPQSWLWEVHLTLQEQKEALRTQQHPWIHPGSYLPNLSAILTVSLYTSISLKCCSEMMSSCCREWCGPGAIYTQLNMVPSTVKERCPVFDVLKTYSSHLPRMIGSFWKRLSLARNLLTYCSGYMGRSATAVT